jgi:hypothetical protein
MDLNARDTTLNDYPPPFPVSGVALWQEQKLPFEEAQTPVSLGDAETEAVAFACTGAYIPEFGGVLESVEKGCSLCHKALYGRRNDLVIRTARLGQPKKDVGVQENCGRRHQSWPV